MGPGPIKEDFVIRELLDPEWSALEKFENKWGLVVLDFPGALEEFQQRARAFRDYPGIPDGTQVWEKSALLREMRALSRQWIASEECDPEGVIGAWNSEGFTPPRDQTEAWVRWARTITAALGRYRMMVGVTSPAFEVWPSVPKLLGGVSIVTACALQLAEMASEGRRILHCANETCLNPRFTRQRAGRRRYEDRAHAEGLKYCSRGCAKAQSERERRRRRRAETKGGV